MSKTSFVPGLGTVTIQDPIEKTEVKSDKRTLAEKASQLPDDKQNQTQTSGMARQVVQMDQKTMVATAEAIQKAIQEKHELLTGHSHDELKETDASEVNDTEMREGIDELTDPKAETGEEEPTIPKKKLKGGDKVSIPGEKKSCVFLSDVDPIVAKSTLQSDEELAFVQMSDGKIQTYPLSELMPD